MTGPATPDLQRRTLLAAALYPLLGERQGNAQSVSNALKVVVTGGHPGDPEYGCGGTIARFSRLGHRVTLLYLNRGEDPEQNAAGCPASSSNNNPRVREAAEACRILGATPAFAPQCNGRAIVDNPHYSAFTELLAELEPDVLFTQWPIDNHPDHRAISNLTVEAWNRLGRTAAFYYYEVSNGEDTLMFSPTEYVDITEVEELKRQACYAHASQAPGHFYPLQAQVAGFRGIEAGYTQAEAYVRHVRSHRRLLP